MADQVFNGDLAREYVPNADAADQNATADPLSILSLLTLIGTDTAVITLPGVKGTATVYTVGSNSDFASSYPNVTFKVLSGAVIAHGAYTLKLHLEAGQYQVFDGTGAVTLVNADKILPRWFGALGDGATDDIVPIRKAFASQAASQVAYLANATNYVFSVPVVAFDNSHWEISDAITPGSQAMRIRGNGAILRLTDGTKNFFECSVAYRIEHEGMTFVGGNSVFNFGNDNLGPAWIYGKDNEYTWGGGNSGAVFNFYLPGITVNLSVNLVIENSSFLYNYQILNSQPGADATFRTNWFIGTNPIAAVAQFVNRSNLTLDNFQGSPSAGACPLGARWVDNYGSFNAVNATRFGSEGNGMPIVYNYIGPDGVYPGGTGAVGNGKIVIENCTVAPGGTAVENTIVKFVTDIPQLMVIRNNNYVFNDGASIFKSDAGFDVQTYLEALDAFVKIRIVFRNNEGIPWLETTGHLDELASYNKNQVYIDTDIPLPILTLAVDAVYPDIANRQMFRTANANPTTILYLNDAGVGGGQGVKGHRVKILIDDNNTQVDFSNPATLHMFGNNDLPWAPVQGDWMDCESDEDGNWYCQVSRPTSLVSDTAYDATTWDGVTTVAPSKNAVRDKIEAMISDTAYDATSWDAVTTVSPSKNAVRDKVEAMISDTAYDATSWDGVTGVAPSKNAVRDKFESLVTPAYGDWTAALACGTSGTITLSANTGRYVTIGKMVLLTGQFTVSSVSSPVGTLSMTGIPYAAGTGAKYTSSVSVYVGTLEAAIAEAHIQAVIAQTTQAIGISKVIQGEVAPMAADIKAGSYIVISAMYITD